LDRSLPCRWDAKNAKKNFFFKRFLCFLGKCQNPRRDSKTPRIHLDFKNRCLTAWRELNQFNFYRRGVVIIHSGTLNDASGFGAVEVGRRIAASSPGNSGGPALAFDKFVGLTAREQRRPPQFNLLYPCLFKVEGAPPED
jgi:hypothetical protein